MEINNPIHKTRNVNFTYYLRKDKDSPTILGPTSFLFAHDQALKLSEGVDYGGTMQIYTLIGDRYGDPNIPPVLQVVAVYVNGKMILGGWKADRNSRLGVPYDTSRKIGK